ncbi:hypothetical protein AOG1_06210 [Geobacter sp. AOG1]|nr:hypothetical protein AOG1_06210 [Geobacter sp. AOG1]
MVSKYYETVLALILCYLLILSIYMESVPPAQPSNEMKSDQKW